MKRVIRLSGKLMIIFAAFVLSSCGENSALQEEILYFQEESTGWLTDDVRGDNFIMIDDNGISSSFNMDEDHYYWDKSWTTVLGINTHMTRREYHYQTYRSNYGAEYSLSLTAGYPPRGDQISIHLDELGFIYDLDFEIIRSIDTYSDSKSLAFTEGGYEENGENIYSTVEILSEYTIANQVYDTVLFFQLRDFAESWHDFMPLKIYVAKNTGLVSYELKNGITYTRK